MALRMVFNPDTLKRDEQPEIIRLCNLAWKHPSLTSSTEAVVYSAPSSRGRVWWHVTENDKREHITVRYNRRANRAHIYRDGTVNVSPQKPLRMKLKSAPEAEDEEGYESASELSGEEFSDDE
ncbi:hypothetical protein PQX77_021086 [Marasmius sp. AFHP31]|nr:hypothetical protein PQX77_021086 [Marasmius sp. AFHP31]